MRLNRFIGNFQLKIGKIKLSDDKFINQLRNVLKLKIGEKIILCDGLGSEGITEIIEYGNDSVEVEIKAIRLNENEPKGHVILYCAILKRENFELVVQKATEAGVKEIVPIITERTVKLNIRQDRLEKIISEAAEQSGRGVMPVLREEINLEEAVAGAKNEQFNVFFDSSGENFDRVKYPDNIRRVGVWIGPEGGWSDREIKLAEESNFKITNLGKLTLRAETAAIISVYIIVHNF